MGEAPVRLGNLRLFVLKANLVNNGGGCSGEGGSVGGGGSVALSTRKMESIMSGLEARPTQRDFHVCYLAGDKATNRAQTSELEPPEAADSLTSSLICVSCVLDLAKKRLLLQADIVHVYI